MKGGPRFEPNRGDVRALRHTHPLAYIIRELPARLQALSRELHCPPDGRVVDYGCADTPYRHFFPGSVEYLAADLVGNPDATLLLNSDGTVPVADESVDVVLSTQVLEHVADPALYLSECRRVLRPRGRMLLSTHGFMVYHPDPVDFWRWTCAGLREAVEREGLRIVRFEGIMGLRASGLQLVQDGFLYRVPTRLRGPFAYLMQRTIAFVDRHEPAESRDMNALVFALVAEKPAQS
ncbi:MAG TPA: class I SAM-dependent methyltransferase [Solirubrobacteraceae bacterium]